MSERVKSGVYIITNTVTGECYIGSSVNVEKRLTQHRYMLRLGRHHSRLLQSAWNQRIEDDFTFDILEIVPDLTQLVNTEQHYLDERQPIYNPAKIALRNGAGTVSDPQKLQDARDAASRGRFMQIEFFDSLHREIHNLRKVANRDDDIMKVLSVALSLSSEEREIIEYSADMATILYQDGLTSGRQFIDFLNWLSQHRMYNAQVLEDEWLMRGVTAEEATSLTENLYSVVMGVNPQPLPSTMTAMGSALNALASTVSRELHVTNDSQGYPAIAGDVQKAGEIVGRTRKEIEAATGRAVVSPRNMLCEPDGGIWAQLPTPDEEPDQG